MPECTNSPTSRRVWGPWTEPRVDWLATGELRSPEREGNAGSAVFMAHAALALHTDRTGRPANTASILGRLTEATAQVIPQAEHVVLLSHTQTATLTPMAGQILGPAVQELLQAENEHSPFLCLSAAAGGQAMICDVRQERRWPELAAVAWGWGLVGLCATPVRHPGSKAVLLWASRDTIGDDAAAAALAWSVHVGIALTAAESREHFGAALTSRDVIGQAKGIVMERFELTAEQAFVVLVKASTDSNTKLRVICDQLCLTGELPTRKLK